MEKASEKIDISKITLGKIENEQLLSVRKTVYRKLADWLLNDKEK